MTKRISILGSLSMEAMLVTALSATGSQFELVGHQKPTVRKVLKGFGPANVDKPINGYQKKQRENKRRRKGGK